MNIFFSIILGFAALIFLFGPFPEMLRKLSRALGFSSLGLGLLLGVGSVVGYNDSGYCVHIRTIFGSESSKCDLGWYFAGWGNSTVYPHYITISHTNERDAEGSAIARPYLVRMADNWAGEVTQTTRFGIPQDPEQFLKMARDFRSPERLITSTLRPAVTASLDSVANLYTMEEYFAGGRRDDFKTEFRDAVVKGRVVIERYESVSSGANIDRSTAPSTSNLAADTAETGGTERLNIITRKKLDEAGVELRVRHGFLEYGIIVSTAILQNLDPDDAFELQIKERKDAAARRSVAREKRLEQEEQRLLALANAERAIAERQGEARENQIQKTTDAETTKRLALIKADQVREEAKIQRETAQIQLERAQIDAEAVKVAADAEAHAKQAILQADGALAQKLKAWVEAQNVWAQAYSTRKVPTTVFGANENGTGSDMDVQTFMNLLTVQSAKQLQLDTSIKAAE